MTSARTKTAIRALLFFLLIFPSSTLVAQNHLVRNYLEITQATIVWNNGARGADSVDQESYAALTASIGFAARRLDVRNLDSADFDEHTLLLVPHASSRLLPLNQARHILQLMGKGLKLVTGGESPLLSSLGIALAGPVQVSVVVDRSFPLNYLHWADRPAVRWIAALPGGPAEVLYTDSATAHPLVIMATFGKGGYIVLAPPLDPLSGKGYSRFPALATAIVGRLGCTPPFRRQGVDAYFDPGYRYSMPIDSLAGLWKRWGIRAVHAAAWYYSDTPRYDYGRLIDAAHRNGVLVYAWLEWPHVGRGFWQRHPAWRQKTALLQDARLDWLLLMDLQNADCMHAALNDLSRQMRLDWDGVDVAEFTITGAGAEALAGPSRPDYFTSFGPTMRKEFQAAAGFDPLELEEPGSDHFWKRDSLGLEQFYRYRMAVNNRLLRQVVGFLSDLKKEEKRDWELMHTIVDNSLHPEFDRLLGFDLHATVDLLKEYGVTLNVEDPYMEWDEPPVRYRRLRETLMSLLPGRSSMIDINVVPIHAPTQYGFASAQATGSEFLQQLQVASEHQGRVCVYSESTVPDRDWALAPYAMAGGCTVKRTADGWDVRTPATVALEVQGSGALRNNGKPWTCYGPEGIVLPAGLHHLSFGQDLSRNTPPAALRLIALSGELVDCKAGDGGFEAVYRSPSRCLVTVSARPETILIDGAEARISILKNQASCVLQTPSGEHRLRVTVGGRMH